MEIQLVAGREFTDQDSADSPPVAIVNERFARRYFGAQNPVGRQLSAKVSGERKDLEVIGLVKDTSVAGLRNAPPPTVYVSRAQLTGDRPATLEIRAGGALGAVPEALRQTLQHRLPGTTIDVRPLSAQVNATIVQERMMATLAGGFGLLALALACIGLYGLLAYTVARQTQEIGIRMALGAQRKQVVARVLADSARLVLIGIAIGAPATWAAARWVESMMFGLKPTDPTAIGGAILVLVAAAQLAAYLPARRASQVDPLTALRHE
jgi:predicted permease